MPGAISHGFDYRAFSKGCMETLLRNAAKEPRRFISPSFCPGPVARKRAPVACMYCDIPECPHDLEESQQRGNFVQLMRNLHSKLSEETSDTSQ